MGWIRRLSTSKNLTVLGIITIVGALSDVAKALFDGEPSTNPRWDVALLAIISGVSMILAKGAQSTGGTVAETAEAAKRIG